MTSNQWFQTLDLPDAEKWEKDPHQWLAEQAARYGLQYLLAFADDGVIWGCWDQQHGLRLADSAFPKLKVALRTATLQQIRLFGVKGELFIWRNGNEFACRLIQDDGTTGVQSYWLWGTAREANDGFSLMVEGTEGLRHAPPLVLPRGGRAVLKIKNYLAYDDQGQAYIAGNRLVEVQPLKGDAA